MISSPTDEWVRLPRCDEDVKIDVLSRLAMIALVYIDLTLIAVMSVGGKCGVAYGVTYVFLGTALTLGLPLLFPLFVGIPLSFVATRKVLLATVALTLALSGAVALYANVPHPAASTYDCRIEMP